ncbi:Gfo/Idh/MocA family oxidoreductase [Streptomyces flaveolus]|uniref:Gfo/Idh/MocA family protein n=1 Tax=Streptomyces flaveolus TaxID=67297 RepID=UPI003424840A
MAAALRAAVIGCGNVAGNHAAAYRDLPGVDLVACADVDPDRAARLARPYGAVASHPDDLFGPGLDLDLVSVCTPHPTHEAVVTRAAAHGVHVLCEKPIATELAAVGRMVAACEAAGVIMGWRSSAGSGPPPAASARRSTTAPWAPPSSGTPRSCCTATRHTTPPTPGAEPGRPTAGES